MTKNECLVFLKKIATWPSKFIFCQDRIERDVIIFQFFKFLFIYFIFYGLSQEATIDSWLLSTLYSDFQIKYLKYATFLETKPLDEFLDHKWP